MTLFQEFWITNFPIRHVAYTTPTCDPYTNGIPTVCQAYITPTCDPFTTVCQLYTTHTCDPSYTTSYHCIYHRIPPELTVYPPYANHMPTVCHTGCMTDKWSQLKYISATSQSHCICIQLRHDSVASLIPQAGSRRGTWQRRSKLLAYSKYTACYFQIGAVCPTV